MGCRGCAAGLQSSICAKSPLTWKWLLTSKFDTAANKQCQIYILISGSHASVGDEFKCSALYSDALPHCPLVGGAQQLTQRNHEELPGAKGQRHPPP